MAFTFDDPNFGQFVDVEDSGMAKIGDLATVESEGLFVRIQSWSESANHPDFDSLIGKHIRVTIEVVE